MVAKGVFKGTVAVAAGYVSQQAAFVPPTFLAEQAPVVAPYLNFVIGTFVGLVFSDIVTRDVTPGKPVLGAAKGLSGALGAAVPLVYLTDVQLFYDLCANPAVRDALTSAVGAGNCYPYLTMVAGTFVGTVVGDIVLAPFSQSEKKKRK